MKVEVFIDGRWIPINKIREYPSEEPLILNEDTVYEVTKVNDISFRGRRVPFRFKGEV